ncbi:hypothetical protein DASC09_000350 [Saccharomycopsis crataegensis]|uniref:Mitochondrial 15S rRNA processing factor CCM1 n=1 Tax=Saccharomycopsis crataegensis TaxID=43959 RepID=A0AAV5QCP4_9ASCO|nr:hypothetical protein DASC09_000350 [Saccharomycopsis crataegensis]
MLNRRISAKSAGLIQLALRNRYVASQIAGSRSNLSRPTNITQNHLYNISSFSTSSRSNNANASAAIINESLDSAVKPPAPISKMRKPTPDFKPRLEEFNKVLDEMVEKSPYDGFEFLTANLDNLNKTLRLPYYRYLQFIGKTLKKLLAKSLEESKNPTGTNLSDPEKIFEYYVSHKMASYDCYLSMLHNYILSDQLEKSIELYAKYVENNQGKEMGFRIQMAGYISYLLYITKNDIKLDVNYIQKVFPFESAPFPTVVINTLKNIKAVTDKKLLEQVRNAANSVFSANIDVNDPKIYSEMRSLAESGFISEVGYKLEKLRRAAALKNEKLPETFFTEGMNIYSRANVGAKSLFLWNEMISSGIKPSVESWNALIVAVSKKGDKSDRKKYIDEVFKRLTDEAQLKPNANTYCALIKSYANVRDFDAIEEVFEKLVKEKLVPVTLKVKCEYLRGLALKDVDRSFGLCNKWIENNEFIPDVPLINTYIEVYVSTRQFEKASQALGLIESLKLKPDVATYTIILHMLFSQTRSRGEVVNQSALKDFLKEMTSNDLSMNSVTISLMINGLMKDGMNYEAGRSLFDYFQRHYPLTRTHYSSMIQGEFQAKNHDGAEALFERYIKTHKKINNNVQMYNMIINEFTKAGKYNKAYEWLVRIKTDTKDSIKPNHFSYFFLMNDLDKQDNVELAQLVVNNLAENTTLNHYGKRLPGVLTSLQKKGVKVPDSVFNVAQKEHTQKDQ